MRAPSARIVFKEQAAAAAGGCWKQIPLRYVALILVALCVY